MIVASRERCLTPDSSDYRGQLMADWICYGRGRSQDVEGYQDNPPSPRILQNGDLRQERIGDLLRRVEHRTPPAHRKSQGWRYIRFSPPGHGLSAGDRHSNASSNPDYLNSTLYSSAQRMRNPRERVPLPSCPRSVSPFQLTCRSIWSPINQSQSSKLRPGSGW